MANLGYLQVARGCNQHCRFCSNPSNGWELELAEASRALDGLVARGYYGVILTGGEPSLSPIVPEISRRAGARGLHVRMITNGSRLSDPSLVREYASAGLRHFHVSIHSAREDVQDFLAGTRGSWRRIAEALENLGRSDAVVNVNTVINKYNADHLLETVRYLHTRFPFVSHYVWNNLDPSMGRAEANGDCLPRLGDFELSLARAMRYLASAGRTFRVERVPLCYMTDFAHCSTETRKIGRREERIVHFLDEKGTVRQTDFRHSKSAVCAACSLDGICAGLFAAGEHYDPAELFPVFVDPAPIAAKILKDADR